MKRIISLVIFAIGLFGSTVMAAIIDFRDGGPDTISNTLYQNDYIRLDFDTVNDPGTHITITDGAIIDSISAFNIACITLKGGEIKGRLFANDNTIITLENGTVHDLQSGRDATVTMTGGTVDILVANTSSTITVSGGLVTDHLTASNNGTIYLDGSGFEVTDLSGKVTSLSYGDNLSILGTLVENRPDGVILDYYAGTITGILSDGSVLNSDFYINNLGARAGTADIFIIPEPATLLLFGLGGLVLRRRLSAGV